MNVHAPYISLFEYALTLYSLIDRLLQSSRYTFTKIHLTLQSLGLDRDDIFVKNLASRYPTLSVTGYTTRWKPHRPTWTISSDFIYETCE